MQNAVNKAVGTFVLAGLCACGLAATAWPAGMTQPRVEYSADQTISGEGQTFQSKIFRAREKQRMEMSAGGTGQVFITRLDKKVSWVLMPEQRMYTELSLGQAQQNAPNDLRECAMETTKAGAETVNGYATTRYNMKATCPDGTRYSGSIWATKDDIPVKTDATLQGASGAGRRVVIELRNLKIGKQDPALFDIPQGYSKFTIPAFGGSGGLMGGAAPQRKAPPEQAASEGAGQDSGRSYTAQPRDAGAPSSGGVPRAKKGQADAGRSYTAQPRGAGSGGSSDSGNSAGRSYTSQPRDSGAEGTLDKAIGTGQKLKRLFGW